MHAADTGVAKKSEIVCQVAQNSPAVWLLSCPPFPWQQCGRVHTPASHTLHMPSSAGKDKVFIQADFNTGWTQISPLPVTRTYLTSQNYSGQLQPGSGQGMQDSSDSVACVPSQQGGVGLKFTCGSPVPRYTVFLAAKMNHQRGWTSVRKDASGGRKTSSFISCIQNSSKHCACTHLNYEHTILVEVGH